MNVVVVRGLVREEPQTFTTKTGAELCTFEVMVDDGESRDVVPILWPDPPGDAPSVGDEVTVRGRVRKRFLRGPGGVRPRTDVIAAQVVLTRRRRQVERLLAEASVALES
jgi:hypothetical protein